MTNVKIGLERCLEDVPATLAGARFGLLMNQASVDKQARYACDLLAEKLPGQLAAVFTPQHGLWCEQQANMIESPHTRYEPLGVPVFSLYSETRQPTAEMLRGIECLVVDLQDVGTRVYTFVWTVLNCLKACSSHRIPVVVLDRPNPLGGEIVEGPLLERGFESFVGMLNIPMRHGLTIGELALLGNRELQIGADLHVIAMSGWRREMLFPETGRTWTLPSPNMPRFETALCYPGQVLLEGTNLSEGRGTTVPFELVGAPFIDPQRLLQAIGDPAPFGLLFRPVRFVPTFDKWRGESCGGLAWHITEPNRVRSFAATTAVLAAVQKLWPHDFQWLPPPYEYEREKMPIDILFGSSRIRDAIHNRRIDASELADLVQVDRSAWETRTTSVRLYS